MLRICFIHKLPEKNSHQSKIHRHMEFDIVNTHTHTRHIHAHYQKKIHELIIEKKAFLILRTHTHTHMFSSCNYFWYKCKRCLCDEYVNMFLLLFFRASNKFLFACLFICLETYKKTKSEKISLYFFFIFFDFSALVNILTQSNAQFNSSVRRK